MMEVAIEQARFLIGIALAIAFVVAVIDAAGAAPAWCPNMSVQPSCYDVKAYVAEHGRVRAFINAKLCGATREQIKQARECLK